VAQGVYQLEFPLVQMVVTVPLTELLVAHKVGEEALLLRLELVVLY
jgi:hypothetical protein